MIDVYWCRQFNLSIAVEEKPWKCFWKPPPHRLQSSFAGSALLDRFFRSFRDRIISFIFQIIWESKARTDCSIRQRVNCEDQQALCDQTRIQIGPSVRTGFIPTLRCTRVAEVVCKGGDRAVTWRCQRWYSKMVEWQPTTQRSGQLENGRQNCMHPFIRQLCNATQVNSIHEPLCARRQMI